MRRVRITTGTGTVLRTLGTAAVTRFVKDPEDRAQALTFVDGLADAFQEGVGVELQIGKPKPKKRLPRAPKSEPTP